jgi:hypothetical protein
MFAIASELGQGCGFTRPRSCGHLLNPSRHVRCFQARASPTLWVCGPLHCAACQSWNEKMWPDGGPIDPSPTVDQAISGGYPWLEIECCRCKTPRDVDLAALRRVPTTCVSVSDDGIEFVGAACF